MASHIKKYESMHSRMVPRSVVLSSPLKIFFGLIIPIYSYC